ncbi:MAG: DUF4332 domain-containing protein [bacterium]|nr:DUF4332 domain-containing protein [bacterium]
MLSSAVAVLLLMWVLVAPTVEAQQGTLCDVAHEMASSAPAASSTLTGYVDSIGGCQADDLHRVEAANALISFASERINGGLATADDLAEVKAALDAAKTIPVEADRLAVETRIAQLELEQTRLAAIPAIAAALTEDYASKLSLYSEIPRHPDAVQFLAEAAVRDARAGLEAITAEPNRSPDQSAATTTTAAAAATAGSDETGASSRDRLEKLKEQLENVVIANEAHLDSATVESAKQVIAEIDEALAEFNLGENLDKAGDDVADLLGSVLGWTMGLLALWFLARLVGKIDWWNRWGWPRSWLGRAASGLAGAAVVIAAVMVLAGRDILLPGDQAWAAWLSLAALGVGFILFSGWVNGPGFELKIKDAEVQEGAPKVAKTLPAAVRAEIGAFQGHQPEGIDDLTAPDDLGDTVPSMGESGLGKNASAIAALIAKLVWRRDYVVSMALHKTETQGVGLSIELVRGWKRLASDTLWAGDYLDPGVTEPTLVGTENPEPAADDWAVRLARPAAVWILAKLRRPSANHGTRLYKPKEIYGSEDWRSSAYCASASAWLTSASDQIDSRVHRLRARRLFLEALDADPQNWRALYNLARLDMRDGHNTAAISRLSAADTAVGNADGPVHASEEHPYRTAYNLGAAHLHRYLLKKPDPTGYPPKDLRWAYFYFQRILKSVGEQVDDWGNPEQLSSTVLKNPPCLPRRGPFRLQITASSYAAAATVLLAAGGPLSRANTLAKKAEDLHPGWRTRYNLACYYSEALGRFRNDTAKNHYARKALEHLRSGVEPAGAIRQWAAYDPSLAALRKHEPTRADFNAIVEGRPIEPTEPAQPTELGRLLLLGEHAGKLASAGIETFDTLVRNAATHGLRSNLANKVPEMSVELLERAATLADLIDQHDDIEAPLANVLERAGVGSIGLLTGWGDTTDITGLVKHLNATRIAMGATGTSPLNPPLVRRLVKRAAKLTPQVLPQTAE